MSNIRYIVGETYYFARVRFVKAEQRFSSLFHPEQDTLQGIDIVELRCTEHHDVPGEWDDRIAYDGFLFEQTNDLVIGKVAHKGAIWSNQYPRASYGQLDDSADRKVSVYHTKEQQTKEFVDSLNEEELDVCVFGLFSEATYMIGMVKRAMDGPIGKDRSNKIRLDLNKVDRAEWQAYLTQFVETLEQASGKKVEFEEWLIEFTDGRPAEIFKDYWQAKLV